MKSARYFAFIVTSVILLGHASLLAQNEGKAIVPLRPAELLKCLPPAGEGWRLLVSNAQDVPDAWPRTKAQREYIFEDVSAGTASARPVLAKVQLAVIDTAGHPGTLERFSSVNPGPSSAPSAPGQVAGMPTIRTPLPDGKERIETLALNRFVIITTLETPAQPQDASKTPKPEFKAESWPSKVDQGVLRTATQTVKYLEIAKDRQMIVERVDELNPKKSSRSVWGFPVEAPPGD